MPSTKKRIALTVPEELNTLLCELAEVQGKPVATVVLELLNSVRPQLASLVTISRAMKAGETEVAKTALRHMVGDAMADVINEVRPDYLEVPRKAAAKKKARK